MPITQILTPKAQKGHYSLHTRTRIKTYVDLGHGIRGTARKFGVSPSTVAGICERYEHQISAVSLPRPGRPPKFSERDKRHVLRVIETDPLISCAKLLEICCPHVKIDTVRRYLRREGVMHQVCLTRPFLTPETVRIRLSFALEHRDKPLSWWRRVLFSDETTIDRAQGERGKWAFRRRGKLYLINSRPYSSTTR